MVVDDVVQQRDVDASCSQIRNDQNTWLFGGKLGGVYFSRRGVELREDVGVADFCRVEQEMKVLDVVSRGGEDDNLKEVLTTKFQGNLTTQLDIRRDKFQISEGSIPLRRNTPLAWDLTSRNSQLVLRVTFEIDTREFKFCKGKRKDNWHANHNDWLQWT